MVDWATWRAEQDRKRRHEQLLDEQNRRHREQLEAIQRKSQSEQALDGKHRTVDVVLRDLQDRSRNLDARYQAEYAKLEASFGDKLSEAIDSRKSKIDEHRRQAGRVLQVWADKLYRERVNQYERVQQLKAWHKELRSWQDRWNQYSGGPMDPEEYDKPDPKTEHRDDVTADVTKAVETLQ